MTDTAPSDTRGPDLVEAWLQAAIADAEKRGLPELKPLLEGLAQSTRQLRAADWNDHVPEGGQAEGGQAEGRPALSERPSIDAARPEALEGLSESKGQAGTVR